MPTNGDTITGLDPSDAHTFSGRHAAAMDSAGNMFILTLNSSNIPVLYGAIPGTSWSVLKTFGNATVADKHLGGIGIDDDDSVHVAYTDTSNDIRYSKSTDGGSTWGVDDEQDVGTHYACIGIGFNSSGDAYMLFTGSNNVHGDGSIRKRTTGGSWSSLTPAGLTAGYHVRMTQRSPSHKMWIAGGEAGDPGAAGLEYYSIDPSDDTVSAILTGPDPASANNMGFNVIEDASGDLHAAWATSNEQCYYGKFASASWSITQLSDLNGNAGRNQIPYVSMDSNGNVYVMMCYSDTTSQTDSLRYQRTTDGGSSFDAFVTFATVLSTNGCSPAYTPGDGSFIMYWDDDGSLEYYETNDFAGPPAGGSPWNYYAQQ